LHHFIVVLSCRCKFKKEKKTLKSLVPFDCAGRIS
jgi:hypothetical protein